MSFRTILRQTIRWPLALAVVSACTPDSPPTITGTATESPDPASRVAGVSSAKATAALMAVFEGNAQTIAAAPALVPPGTRLAPFVEARLYAISNVAMHDALNAIVPRFQRYADVGPVAPRAHPVAAVLTAAHDAIVGAAPNAQSSTDAWYAARMSAYSGAEGLAVGIAIGQRAAAAILAKRANDGTAGGGVAPYVPGSNPGDYRFTFPFNTPGFDFFGTGGFADGSIWGATVTPFVVRSTSQFRASSPYGATSNAAAVLTERYTRDFNEVKALGCAGCTARTERQTEIALFWVENSPTGWNRIARVVADQRNLNAWNSARLFALLQMGEFDAYATNLESKYHYNFWRPVTAIALAGTDGNPHTTALAGWEVLRSPTPPIPDYPSAHAAAGGSGAAIIAALVSDRGRGFATTSTSLPGVTRKFESVAAAALENALSRIYVGFHFRHAARVGLEQGVEVGNYVVENALRPIRSER